MHDTTKIDILGSLAVCHGPHTGGPPVSKAGRTIGFVLTCAMFAFSTHIFIQTGDWVAAVFAVGSLGYGLFFLSAAAGNGS